MPKGTGQNQQGQPGAGVARFLANPASFYQAGQPSYFTPGHYSPSPSYIPTKKGANNQDPAPVTAGPSAPSSAPMPGQPNINAPVGSYEWWQAYNPGADYSRHFGGGGR